MVRKKHQTSKLRVISHGFGQLDKEYGDYYSTIISPLFDDYASLYYRL